METLESLIHEYKRIEAGGSQMELAHLEAELWKLSPVEERNRGQLRAREMFLQKYLGGKIVNYDNRGRLFNSMPSSAPLFERLEKDFSLSTAARILRDAKKLRKTGKQDELTQLIADMLKENDSRPHLRKLANGKITRSRSPSRLPKLTEAEQIKNAIRPSVRKKLPAITEAKAFWANLRVVLAAHVAPMINAAPSMFQERLYEEFEVEMKSVFTSLTRKIDKLKKEGADLTDISRKDLVRACTVLGVNVPRAGKEVDLVKAKTIKRKLMALYHPDKHNGDESLRFKYEEANDACATLEAYNQSLSSEATDGSSNDTIH